MDENKILTKEQRLVLEMRNNLIRRRKQSKMRKAKNRQKIKKDSIFIDKE